MKIYIIECFYPKIHISKVSQVGYSNLMKAQREIESKDEHIQKLNPFSYQSESTLYFIRETIIE